MLNHPVLLLFPASLLLLLVAARGGMYLRGQRLPTQEEREEFSVVMAASLTLLGLIIGFTFSMSISRYDQRKNYEEEEANAIGTEYLRAEFLPSSDAGNEKILLKQYLA